MPETVKLNYHASGHGLPVVLLHGFPLNHTIWRAVESDLSDTFQIIAPDLRGHGSSPAPAGIYEMSLLAADVLGLLDDIGIRQAAILGHSLGGYVALAAWRIAPERILGFGLVASHALADTEEGRQGRRRMADQVAAEGPQVAATAMLPKVFSPDLPLTSPIVDQVRTMILSTSATGIIGTQLGMAARPDSTELLASIHVPALVLAGEKDQIVPLARAQTTASTLPRGTLSVINNVGHMPMLESPGDTTAALRCFLNQLH
ncbi:MAG: alpha/beta fold hydrolase [Planctomycetes bacterium]|nr:alpha/beta fold hydrolase [Planctomycetota bacterium]